MAALQQDSNPSTFTQKEANVDGEYIIQTAAIPKPMNLEQSFLNAQDERFACAGTCGRTFKHNARTRKERASGVKDIYCRPCKLQRQNNMSVTRECGDLQSYECCRVMTITMWSILAILYIVGLIFFVISMDHLDDDDGSFAGFDTNIIKWVIGFSALEMLIITLIIYGLINHKKFICMFGVAWSALHILANVILIIVGDGEVWMQIILTIYYIILFCWNMTMVHKVR